jgi:hypothetical protein
MTENGFGEEFGSMNDMHVKAIARFIPKSDQATVFSIDLCNL